MEAFATSFTQFYPDDVAGLRKRIDEIGVKFAAITGGARSGDIHFEDPASRQAAIENHLGMVRFSKKLGCASPIILPVSVSRCNTLVTMRKSANFRGCYDRAIFHDLALNWALFA